MITRSCTFLYVLLICTAFARAADKPNFVWFISEDNSKHFVKLFDDTGAETPHIRRLAEDGLIFEHAFSNSPVCSVARTTLITSCYAPRLGTQFHRRSVMVPLPAGLKMFPAYLRDAGYYTTNKSKKDYNAIEGKGVWDESSNKASWRKRKSGQPFFHKQSFGTTHESSLHFPKAVMQNQKTATDPKTVFVPPHHPPTETFKYTYARYHDRIQQVDTQIGDVIKQLSDDGVLEDTFIFYFGDHGGVLPRGKGYIYETGLHVPLVVRIPANFKHLVDRQRGSRVKGFVSFIDFGPTLLNLAGIEVPKAVDGRPFLGKGQSAADVEQRDEAFGYADRFDEKYDLVRTLRKGNLKYMRSYQPFNFDALQNNYRYRMLAYQEWRQLYKAGKLNEAQSHFFQTRHPEALYDLASDPYETKNLAMDPQYAKKLAEMRERLANQVKSLPDLSLYPESHLVEQVFAGPTGYGQKHKNEIADLVDIADLSLKPFSAANDKLAAALKSKNPWARYWGLTSCCSHANAAATLRAQAEKLAENDAVFLNRARTAQFLALSGDYDPRPVIMNALKSSENGTESALILNILVMLRDGKTGVKFSVKESDIHASARKNNSVQRRLEYLANKPFRRRK